MCLILLKPANIKLPKMLFKNVYERNKDGFGWMYLNETNDIITGKIVTKHWEEQYEAYQPLENKMVCFHWRFKTQGNISIENTHPFIIEENKLVLMHNGNISGYDNTQRDSDTYQFVNKTLQPLFRHIKDLNAFLEDETSEKIFEQMIGKHNKLMLLNNKKFYPINDFYITNEQYIPEMQGLIFSNTYAWDNQFWYKTAIQNEINNEYISKTIIKNPHKKIFTYDNYKKQYITNNNNNNTYAEKQLQNFKNKINSSNKPQERIETTTLTIQRNNTIKQPEEQQCYLLIPERSLLLQ